MRKLKSARFAACALAVWLGAAPARAASDVVAGVIIALQGKPTVRQVKKTDFKAVKLNQFVYEGDRIRTGPDDRTAIAFVGGAEVRIAGNSTFDVESGGGQRPTSLRTAAGQAWTRLLHGKAGLNVNTPAAVAAVRGTEADIEAGQQTTVKVYEGFVDVYNGRGKQSLTAGQMTRVAGAQSAPETPRAMSASDRNTWHESLKTAGVEKQIQRLQQEAEKRRDLELELNKDGKSKKVKLKLEKK